MRLTRNEVHESIWRQIDELQSQWSWGASMGKLDGEQFKTYAKHQQIWFKRYGKALTAWIFLWFALVIGGAAAVKNFVDPSFAGAFFALMLAIGFVGAWKGYEGNKRTVYPEELENLVDAIELTDVQRVYVDALLGAAQNPALDEAELREAISNLNRLLDDEQRLRAYRSALRAAHGRGVAEDLDEERERIERLMASVNDDVAHAALRRSLEMLESRRKRWEDLEPHLARVDAQLELIRQTMLGARDALDRLKFAPGQIAAAPTIDVEGLRANVDDIYRQTQSIERAVEELHQMA
jgi:hypothetical protein